MADMMPPDVQYCFDGAVELGQLTADVSMYFDFLHPSPGSWYDHLEKLPSNLRWVEGTFAHHAKTEYFDARKSLPQLTCAALTTAGLRAAKWQIREISGHISHKAIDHVIEQDIHGKRGRAMAGKRDLLRQLINDDEYVAAVIQEVDELIERSVKDFDGIKPDDAFAEHNRLIEVENTRKERAREQARQFYSEHCRDRIGWPRDGSPILKPIPSTNRRKRKKPQRVIARSFEFMRSVLGQEKARMFVSGDVITLTGERFDFQLQRPANGKLDRKGHAGMDLTLCDKQGVVLSKLCVYWEDTPVMDQVAALAMHVATGTEEDVIRTANLFQQTADAERNTALVAIMASAKFEREVNVQDLHGLLPLTPGYHFYKDWGQFIRRRAEQLIMASFPRPLRPLVGMLPDDPPHLMEAA